MSQLVLERSTRLPPEPSSAAAARRFVREALVSAHRIEWIDRAELAVSELVTNAVLHAHTAITVAVAVTADHATFSVHDGSGHLPAQRHWGAAATTGRGLSLVASLSVSYGVALDPDGKHVWFRLDDSITDVDESAGEWDLDDFPDLVDVPDLTDLDPSDPSHPRDPPDPPAASATLLGVPVLLWLASQQHQEAVLRELFLLVSPQEVPSRPLDLAGAGRALADLSESVDRAVQAALADGARVSRLPPGHPSPPRAVPATVDARLLVPGDGHVDYAALQDALDLGVRLGAADMMLIRPALPETVALRDWACEQVLAQVNGVPPTPWSGVAHPRFVDAESARDTAPAPRWDDALVRHTERVAVAADDNNRIVAVSASAAELLGWPVDELTGRRVVTIVPERLREAHVSGFTRHLTTGETHVLGVEIDLPMLRRDGSEVTCRFLIERADAGAGRNVYVAWLTPLG